jgi:hypothetical protein
MAVIYLCGVGPQRKSTNENQEHLMNNKFQILFMLFFLKSDGRWLGLCLPGCIRV